MRLLNLTPLHSNFLLMANILMADLDFSGLVNYALKASVGGAIWLGYRLVAEHMDKKKKNKQP